jgi:hypothetical protein
MRNAIGKPVRTFKKASRAAKGGVNLLLGSERGLRLLRPQADWNPRLCGGRSLGGKPSFDLRFPESSEGRDGSRGVFQAWRVRLGHLAESALK